MKASELRNKSMTELRSELTALLQEQCNLRIQKIASQGAQTHLFRVGKRAIARLKTILSEKEGSSL